ncbi:MAG: reverse transcriptase domain-containing protein [Pseudomonadota bacterium]
MKSLYESVRAEANLFSAWRHVKKSALKSPRPEIRGEASEFENKHQTHLKRMGAQLREDRYVFSPVHGALKDKKAREKKGKDPRPIAIAKMEDRVLQRAILQVLQPRRIIDPRDPNSKVALVYDDRLGSINKINRSPYGVGGLLRPYGGVEPALKLCLQAMEQGATHFFQSDIKAFFTAIPTKMVVEIIRKETDDGRFCDLFQDALHIELSNEDELENYARLFPQKGLGVAQGGSLSAFAGNALLYDFDHELNSMGVKAVRYIDDLVVLSPDKAGLDQAVNLATSRLGDLGFALYPPDKATGKADAGLCGQSFNFLGCTLQPKRCVPSKNSVDSKKKEFSKLLDRSRDAIKAYLQEGKPLDHNLSQSLVLKKVGDQLYGWQKSFAFCTDAREFEVLDNHVSRVVANYVHTVQRWTTKVDAKQAARTLGLPSAKEQFLKDKARREGRKSNHQNCG